MIKRRLKSAFGRRKRKRQFPTRPFRPEDIGAEDLQQLRAFYATYSAGQQETARYFLACVYAVCLALVDDKGQFAGLKDDPFFEDVRQLPAADDVFKWVVIFMYGAKKGKKRDRAVRKAKILARYKEEGVIAAEVEQRLVEERGIQNAYRLSTKSQEVDQDQEDQDQQQEDEVDLADLQEDEDHQDQDQDNDEEDPTASSLGQTKAAKVRGSEVKTSTTGRGTVSLELISRHLEARQALKPGPATLAVIVERKPHLGDSEWMEIRLLRVKRRGS